MRFALLSASYKAVQVDRGEGAAARAVEIIDSPGTPLNQR